LEFLENAYRTFGKTEFIHPDPVEFLHRYNAPDREIAGLIAACLAYGRVHQILKSVESALNRLESPLEVTKAASLLELKQRFNGFKHRFTIGDQVAGLVFGAGRMIAECGSLGAFVASNLKEQDETVLGAMSSFTDALVERSEGLCSGLVSSPTKGSACKRLNLYFRWMVRKDSVDFGQWHQVPASKLIIPLDTHMHRFGLEYGLTKRNAADLKTALEITAGFRKYSPNDPVKYDFALTRLGILQIKTF
jgi:uncharacterized protein (TIGR02757 family)